MTKIAVLGHGIVGGGVAELLLRKSGFRTGFLPSQPELAAVLEIRELPGVPYEDLIVRDFSVIENDPEIRIVAETIGGVRAACDFTKRALGAGKHVVTSNKELVAARGPELLALAEKMGVNYLFEAAVGGGIPLIQPLSRSLAANRITEICGILNGTTNYILTKMFEDNCSMLDALGDAKRKGYAEADPTDDVEGKDTCRKIAILASMAFGRHVYPDFVPTTGISYITRAHIAEAADAGYAVKLIGRARDLGGGKTAVLTAPHAVRCAHPFYNVRDVYNAVLAEGDAVGGVMFYGRGAGRLPTASAVLSDIYFCLENMDKNAFPAWPEPKGNPVDNGTVFEEELFTFSDGNTMRVL